MWKKPGGRALTFEATEDFAVDRVAFSWRARFPLDGPVAMTVVDGFSNGTGRLRVSMLGIPLQTQTGPETNVGEAMRYLAEVAWAPHAMAANRELEWRDLDERTVEVRCEVAAAKAAVRWEFNHAGQLVRATGLRPFPIGKTFVPMRWGGDFGEYTDFAHTRVPSLGEAWWELPRVGSSTGVGASRGSSSSRRKASHGRRARYRREQLAASAGRCRARSAPRLGQGAQSSQAALPAKEI
jgi:hypothetical protein